MADPATADKDVYTGCNRVTLAEFLRLSPQCLASLVNSCAKLYVARLNVPLSRNSATGIELIFCNSQSQK